MLANLGNAEEIKESVIFHKVEQIQTSKCSWIMTSAIDLEPYSQAFNQGKLYTRSIAGSLAHLLSEREFDHHHRHLIELTRQDVNRSIMTLEDTYDRFLAICNHIQTHNNRKKRSLLPLGHLFSFLFGTVDQADLDSLKHSVKAIYENQESQAKILNDIVSITNVSRTLINENRLLINGMIDTVITLNTTLKEIQSDLFILLTTRKFLLTHAETLIHSHRLSIEVNNLIKDIEIVEQYMTMFSSGEPNPKLITPELLIRELLKIQDNLPPSIQLPEDPKTNVWHFYKFLSVSHTTHDNKIIVLIKVPLIDHDSTLDLYKVYNLPVFNPPLNKALTYEIEANTFAVSMDRNYMTIPTESEFIECTLASGHFCNLRSALYHMQSSKMCLIALFLKNENAISEYCEMKVMNISGPLALYLDDGTWAIATANIEQMEVTCPTQKHVISIVPPLSMINIQPACSAFSAKFKLPPYFKKFFQGFPLAIKEANLHTPTNQPLDFRAWKSLEVSNLTKVQISQLKQLKPAAKIPVNILKAEIGNLKRLDLDNNTMEWIFIGGGSGSGILLLVIVCLCVYYNCGKQKGNEQARSDWGRPDTEHESLNMKHTKVDAIGSVVQTELGQETVRIQGSERPTKSVKFEEPMYSQSALRLLAQLEKFGVDTSQYHRTSRPKDIALPESV